jgi:hypothetical protein
MKAENIQSNTSAPFLAGRQFGTWQTETSLTIVNRLLKDAQSIHTAQDMKDYCNGYKETLSGSTGSKDSQTSMVRCILKVATGLDKAMADYHKVKTPSAGQKVVQKQIDKGAKGIDALSKALRIPAAPKVSDSDSEGEGETGTNETQDNLLAWWEDCKKLGHSSKYGLTNDEMLAFLAQAIAK